MWSVLLHKVYNAVRFDMTQLPPVARVTEHLASLQEFVAAHPQQQGDAPLGSKAWPHALRRQQ